MLKRSNAVPAIFAGVFVLAAASCGQEQTPTANDTPSGVSLARLSLSQSGVQYADLGKPEALAWGPPGVFAVKGGYVIPDNVRSVIVKYDKNYSVIGEVSLDGLARGIVSVAQIGDDLLALDVSSGKTKIIRVSSGGTVSGSELSLSPDRLTGIVSDDTGAIIEEAGGERLYRVSGNGDTLSAVPVASYTWNGVAYSVDGVTAIYTHERVIHLGSITAKVTAVNHLGLVQLIGSDGSGGVYALAEDVQVGPVVSVKQYLWRFDASGTVVSIASIPLAEQLTAVLHPMALNDERAPTVLITRTDSIEFRRPGLIDHASYIRSKRGLLPGESSETGTTEEARQKLIVYTFTCLTSAQMQSNAFEYLNTWTNISATSINNDSSCTPRIKPAYLGSAGVYGSVSYNWGGFNTPTEFVAGMSANYKAGNLDTSFPYALPCVRGVDCSGFVSRVWGLTSKLTTRTIPQHVKLYTPSPMLLGDVFNKYDDHVVVFVSNATNGINTYESTHYLNYDRVVSIYRPWSTLTGYAGYRSLTSCNLP